MKRWYLLLLCILPLTSFAQKTHSSKSRPKHGAVHKDAATAKPLPSWAAAQHYDAKTHVYFPDYYVYYDPNRGGYVYWQNGTYTFTPAMPPFLEKVDMSRSRIQLLKGLDLDLHPEQNYPNYMKLYPAQEVNNAKVPVPNVMMH